MKLPEGWTSEERDYGNAQVTIIERPGIGGCTINFDRRVAYPGYGMMFNTISATKYAGRGWRDRLIADVVRWLGALAVILLLAPGCAGTWGSWGYSPRHRSDRVLDVGMAASSALLACDVAQTVWASHHGKWDRMTSDGLFIGEANPMLGRRPQQSTILMYGAAAIGYTVAVRYIGLPRWVQAAWFAGVTALEMDIVASNAKWDGVCGVAGTYDSPAR